MYLNYSSEDCKTHIQIDNLKASRSGSISRTKGMEESLRVTAGSSRHYQH